MKDFPLLLLPKEKFMVTAKVEASGIKFLKDTLFPSGERYVISPEGIAACVDEGRMRVIYGQILMDGSIGFYKVIDFTKILCPQSAAIINNHIIVGGTNSSFALDQSNPGELMVTYNMLTGKITVLDIPGSEDHQTIDEFLVEGDKITAISRYGYFNHIFHYNFANPYAPILESSVQLSEEENRGGIYKGDISQEYLALLSSRRLEHTLDSIKYINISRRNDYSNYITLSYPDIACYDKQGKYIPSEVWQDVIIIDNFICMPTLIKGIGLFKIIENEFSGKGEKQHRVQYCNPWNKSIIKILKVPNDEDKLVLIASTDQTVYENILIAKNELLTLYEEYPEKEEWEEEIDYEEYKEYEYAEYDDYEPSYEKYGGAYDFDDDAINDAFEGDPENYWNID